MNGPNPDEGHTQINWLIRFGTKAYDDDTLKQLDKGSCQTGRIPRPTI